MPTLCFCRSARHARVRAYQPVQLALQFVYSRSQRAHANIRVAINLFESFEFGLCRDQAAPVGLPLRPPSPSPDPGH